MARTYLVAFGCCCSFLIGFGQAKSVANKFSIRGHIVGKDTGSVILVYSDFKNEVLADTAQLKDGNFYFGGTTNRVCEALLWCDPSNKEFDNPSMVRFLLEPKNIRVRAIKGSEAKAVIDGSESEREKMKWDDRKSQLLNAKVKYRESGDSLYHLYRQSGIATFKILASKNDKIIDSINERLKILDLAYIRNHRDSYLSMYLLYRYRRKLTVDSLQWYYSLMPSDVRRSAVGFQVLEALYPLTSDNDFRRANPLVDIKFDERLRKVRSVYDLNLKDTSGNSRNLAAFKGKYLVLDFWTSTCQPCIENIPAIRQIRTRTDSNFIQFIGISLDTEPDYWKSAIKKYGFDLVQLSDLQGFHGITPVFCKVLWVPKYVIVDKEGKIINYNAPQPVNPDFEKLIDRLAQDYGSNNYHR